MLLIVGVLLGLVVAYPLAHLALIEVGREVVVLHKWTADGSVRKTRLWIVDEGGYAWLHAALEDSPWLQRLDRDPIVTIERDGRAREYRASPDREADTRVHELLREKYGIADWWVRFVLGGKGDCRAVPVRLEPGSEGLAPAPAVVDGISPREAAARRRWWPGAPSRPAPG